MITPVEALVEIRKARDTELVPSAGPNWKDEQVSRFINTVLNVLERVNSQLPNIYSQG